MPIVVVLSYQGKRSYVNTIHRVAPSQWNAKTEKVISHPLAARMNIALARTRLDVEDAIIGWKDSGEFGMMSPEEIFRRLRCIIKGEKYESAIRLLDYMRSFADIHMNARTRMSYLHTVSRIIAFDPQAESLAMNGITVDWLSRFDAWMAKTAPSANSRSIHMRNIRATINDAIKKDLIEHYPFKKFSIKSQPTEHRALTADQMRTFMATECMPHERRYKDMFLLMFFLCGLAPADLFKLKEIKHGRISIRRSKTGQPVDVRVEPEAMEIIDRYRGKEWLLNIGDNYANYDDFLKKMNRSLKTLGGVHMEERIAKDGKVRIMAVRHKTWPELSAYWARHTWASIASSLGISNDVIAHALGHSQRSVTDIYIAFDKTRVDEANRRVIDHVMRKE